MGTKLFDLVTLTLMFDPRIKNFNLGYNFQMVCTRKLIFHMSVPCDKIFSWVPKFFDLVTLTLMFDLFIKNFNLGYNFQMVCTGMLIFHMSIPCDKIFSWVPKFLTMWPWRWCLTYLLKTLTLAITFKWYVLGCWYFTWVFLVTRSFHVYQTLWPCGLDVWPSY
jgi:hypothetical protein